MIDNLISIIIEKLYETKGFDKYYIYHNYFHNLAHRINVSNINVNKTELVIWLYQDYVAITSDCHDEIIIRYDNLNVDDIISISKSLINH